MSFQNVDTLVVNVVLIAKEGTTIMGRNCQLTKSGGKIHGNKHPTFQMYRDFLERSNPLPRCTRISGDTASHFPGVEGFLGTQHPTSQM